MGKTYAQMLAAQKKANQVVDNAPIDMQGANATNLAMEETPRMQQALAPATAAADNTRVNNAPVVDDAYLDAPAGDETEQVHNATEEASEGDEESTIRMAMKHLGDKLREAAPHIDFAKEYQSLLEENKKPKQRHASPLHAFALALGGGEQAVNRLEDKVKESNNESDSEFQRVFDLKKQALEGDIQQKLSEGKFKQALAQTEEMAKMNSVLDRIKGKREHGYRIDEINETNKGKTAVATIKATTAKEAFQSRLSSLADTYKLQGEIRNMFFRTMFTALGARMTQQDVTGAPVMSSDDFVKALGEAEDWAEEHSGVDLKTPLPKPGSLGGQTPAANETEDQKAQRILAELRKK